MRESRICACVRMPRWLQVEPLRICPGSLVVSFPTTNVGWMQRRCPADSAPRRLRWAASIYWLRDVRIGKHSRSSHCCRIAPVWRCWIISTARGGCGFPRRKRSNGAPGLPAGHRCVGCTLRPDWSRSVQPRTPSSRTRGGWSPRMNRSNTGKTNGEISMNPKSAVEAGLRGHRAEQGEHRDRSKNRIGSLCAPVQDKPSEDRFYRRTRRQQRVGCAVPFVTSCATKVGSPPKLHGSPSPGLLLTTRYSMLATLAAASPPCDELPNLG